MKKTFLFLMIFCSKFFCSAQPGTLDATFGDKGIIRSNLGVDFNYQHRSISVLTSPDGSIYLVEAINGKTIISKENAVGISDNSYGTNGRTIAIQIGGVCAAMQMDGKIVVAGNTTNSAMYASNGSDFAVARYNIDGSIDKSFNGNGIAVIDMGYSEFTVAVAIQKSGEIVVAGYSQEINYLTPTHDCIVTFTTDGHTGKTYRSIIGKRGNTAVCMALQADGKIILGGYQLLRYNSDLSIDSSFDGLVQFFFRQVNAVAVQSDGKIIAASNDETNFILTRFNIDSKRDTSFNHGEILSTDFGGAETVDAIALQPDGKILISGNSASDTKSSFAIARYNTNGTLDNNFSGDGKQLTDFGSGKNYSTSITLQADGRILSFGYSIDTTSSYTAVVRYAINGNPDPDFGRGGIMTDHISQGATNYTSIAIQVDGKILAAGLSWNGSNNDFAVARYNKNGTLDDSFSGTGKLLTDFNTSNDQAKSIAIQSDGKIITAGSSADNFALVRYQKNGSLDNNFGVGGKVITSSVSPIIINAIAIQADGKIIAGGSALARYNSDGTLDKSYNSGGKLITMFSDSTAFNCNSLAIQKDQKVIIISGNQPGTWRILRYNLNGSVDSSFGKNGIVSIQNTYQFNLGSLFEFKATSIAISNDGDIVIGGYTLYQFRTIRIVKFAVLKLHPDGSFNNSFNNTGVVTTDIYTNPIGIAVKVQADNKIVLAGYSYTINDNFTLCRYNIDGSLDSSFGVGGKQVSNISNANNRISAIVISGNKLYAAGYAEYPGSVGVVARYLLDDSYIPVTLSAFTAKLQKKSVQLQWQTSNENKLDKFIIERSTINYNFYPIATINAKGNSNTNVDYSELDKLALKGKSFYRLKMIAKDGTFKYCDTVTIVYKENNFNIVLAPNPVRDVLKMLVSGDINEIAMVEISGINGKKYKEIKVSLNGKTVVPIDISELRIGVYFLHIIGDSIDEIRLFIKI